MDDKERELARQLLEPDEAKPPNLPPALPPKPAPKPDPKALAAAVPKSWEARSAEKFGNVVHIGSSAQAIRTTVFTSIASQRVEDTTYEHDDPVHNRYFWTQRVSKFWLKHLGNYELVAYGIYGCLLLACILYITPYLSSIAPLFLCASLVAFCLFSFVPLWPRNNIFAEFSAPPTMVQAREKYSTELLGKVALYTALFCAVPSLLVCSRDLSQYYSKQQLPLVSESYGLLITTMKIYLSTFAVVAPFVFLVSLVVWDLFVNVPTHFPVNPAFVEMHGAQPPFAHLKKHIDGLRTDPRPTAQRMVRFFDRRGGHFNLGDFENPYNPASILKHRDNRRGPQRSIKFKDAPVPVWTPKTKVYAKGPSAAKQVTT